MDDSQVDSMLNYIRKNWTDSVLPSLCDFIRIPAQSPSFDSDWEARGELDQAIELFCSWLDTLGIEDMTYATHRLPGRTPILLVDVPGTGSGDVLFYSHLFGRGSVDDGYGSYLCALAVQTLRSHEIPHPRCRFLIETCEESGSFDLPPYLDSLSDEIGTPDLVVVLDSGAGDYENIWVTESLRGLVAGTLKVEVSSEGVHSGFAGGIIPETFRIARNLISRVENSTTGEILVPEFHVEIDESLRNRAERIVEVLGDSVWNGFPMLEGVEPQVIDPVEVVLNGNWRPALAVIGANGFPSTADAGNVLRPFSEFSLSFRIPPGVDSEIALQAVKKILESNPPHGAKVTFSPVVGADGFRAPPLHPSIDSALNRAAQHLYGENWMPLFEGGTIPFLSMMQNRFPDAAFLVTGSMGPDGNAHGPDEKLHVPASENLTLAISLALNALSKG